MSLFSARILSIAKVLAVLAGLLILVGIGVGVTVYIARNNPTLLGIEQAQQVQAQREQESLVREVGELISLPTDERPTIATVSDASKLSAQPFFANTKNGDKVLIYTSAKKAIIYRPSDRRIIDVGSVLIREQDVASPSAEPVATPTRRPAVSPTATTSAQQN